MSNETDIADWIEREREGARQTGYFNDTRCFVQNIDVIVAALRRVPAQGKPDSVREALRLIGAEDERQTKLHELLETIREQIRVGVAPEHRPDGLFKNIQDAVYAMRGRTPLLNDAAIVGAFDAIHAEGQPTIIDEMHTALAEMHDSMARAREMLADVPGNSFDEALTNYIGSYMALQVEVQELRSRSPAASGNLSDKSLWSALEAISRTTFSGSEMDEAYMRGNRDAHATCARMAKAALRGRSQPESSEQPTDKFVDAFLKAEGSFLYAYTAERESGVALECDITQEDADEINAEARAKFKEAWRAATLALPSTEHQEDSNV